MSEKRKVVIIGGGSGGSTVASFLRKFDRKSEIVVFEAGKWPTYSSCGLPYALAKIVEGYKELIELTPAYYERLKIKYFLETPVIEIKPKSKTVVYKTKEGDEKEKNYDVLVIATGSIGRRLNVEGSNLRGIFLATTIDYFLEMDKFIETRNVRKAAVVGAGFIAAEVAEALAERGIKVYVLHRGETILRKQFDPDFAKTIMSYMERHGVIFMPGRHVNKYVGEKGYVKKVITEEGDEISVDMVVEAIGAVPNVGLAKRAGIEISGQTGGIKVNEYMETSVKGIYAVGDVAESYNAITGKKEMSMLATTAFRQARTLVYHLMGKNVKYPGHLNTSGIKAFELYAGTTGLINTVAKREGFNSVAIPMTLPSNPHYFPDTKDIKLKLIVDRDSGRIIGAEALSEKNVADLITAASYLIMNKVTVLDATLMDWCYTPPLSYDWNVIVEAAFQAVKRLKIV